MAFLLIIVDTYILTLVVHKTGTATAERVF